MINEIVNLSKGLESIPTGVERSAALEKSEIERIHSNESIEPNSRNEVGLPDIEVAKKTPLEVLFQENSEKIGLSPYNSPIESSPITNSFDKLELLSDDEKVILKEKSGWSDIIIENIRTKEEYDIYKKADLEEAIIGNNPNLIRSDIEWNQKDEKGRTNSERIERGLSPLDKEGNAIELHHIGQHENSPLAELSFKEHRCNGNDTVLHNKKIETETHGEGNTWSFQRQDYWQARFEYNEKLEVK